MVKTKTKTRAQPKKRKLYEISGGLDDLLPSSKKRARLDHQEEEKQSSALRQQISYGHVQPQPSAVHTNMPTTPYSNSALNTPKQSRDASTLSPDKAYDI